jgi:coenzyme F420-0:L-glutamate ligase/coenzyme F420-1:gamma-L-glutamate ligase
MERGLIISETYHGFKCANAGVDMSNMPDTGTACLLPKDPDASARCIRMAIEKLHDIRLAVIISDSFGRPWREGIVNVAIGTSGLDPLRDLRETKDAYGHPLQSTVLAVADELAAAAGMVMAKDSNIPVALIKGYTYNPKEQRASILLRPQNQDLFL